MVSIVIIFFLLLWVVNERKIARQQAQSASAEIQKLQDEISAGRNYLVRLGQLNPQLKMPNEKSDVLEKEPGK